MCNAWNICYCIFRLVTYIRRYTSDCIRPFLCNRSQNVLVNGNISRSSAVTSGVPQGTGLGPLLFRLYINDISSDIKSKIRLFADDSAIYREIIISIRQCHFRAIGLNSKTGALYGKSNSISKMLKSSNHKTNKLK